MTTREELHIQISNRVSLTTALNVLGEVSPGDKFGIDAATLATVRKLIALANTTLLATLDDGSDDPIGSDCEVSDNTDQLPYVDQWNRIDLEINGVIYKGAIEGDIIAIYGQDDIDCINPLIHNGRFFMITRFDTEKSAIVRFTGSNTKMNGQGVVMLIDFELGDEVTP